MPPQQRDDQPLTIRLWHLFPVVLLGWTAFMLSALCCVLIMPSGGHVQPSTMSSTSNVGDLGHVSPREVALSWSATLATHTLTSKRLADLPWWASNSQREKAAIEAVNELKAETVTDTLLNARDWRGQTRLSTTAAFVERMGGHESCPVETDVQKNGKTHHLSTAGRETSCSQNYDTCYDLCDGGLWTRPALGSCHVVCVVLKNHCEMCRKKTTANSKRVGRRVRSWLSATLPPEGQSDDAAKPYKSWFTDPRACWMISTICLVQMVGFVVWIRKLCRRLEETERRMREMIKAQEERAAEIVSNENRGIFATSRAFVIGWTTDRIRQLEIIAYIHP